MPWRSCESIWSGCGVENLNANQQQIVWRVESFNPALKQFFPTVLNQFINNIYRGELCLNFRIINQLASYTRRAVQSFTGTFLHLFSLRCGVAVSAN